MPKDKKINIRLTEKEKKLIESKAKKYNMTITKFIVSSCLKDKIIIINGLDKIDTELRRKRNEYRVAEKGKSWKFKLINAIDLALAESNNKEEFIKSMNKLGYQVNWTDTRKYITYTTSEGYKCRDSKLYDEKYSKGAMENEFRRTIK